MQLIVPGFEGLRSAIEAPRQRAARPARAPSSDSQRAIILGVLAKHGDLSAHGIATFCRLTAVEVGKRLPELARSGAIVRATHADTGHEATRTSPLGRLAAVWRRAA